MTKSEMFKRAHETARATKAIVGDYRIAFSLALKELYAGMKKVTKSITELTMAYKILDAFLGGLGVAATPIMIMVWYFATH